MFGLNPYNILAGLVFSTIGMGAFGYGRKLELWQPKLIGMLLMFFPCVVYNPYALWAVGVGLIGVLWKFHDE